MSRNKWLLATICAAYVSCAAAYTIMTPAWESNDEYDHVAYIERLLARHSLPLLDGATGHQAHQPPLYYSLAAFWQAAVTVRAFAPDPIVRALKEPISANRSTRELMLGHGYSATQRAHAIDVHELRVLSILLGLATVMLTFLVGRAATGQAEVGLGAAAFVALLPKFIVVTATVTNDALVIPLCSLALLLALRLRVKPPSRRRLASFGTLGLVLGAATLTKLSALPLTALLLLSVSLFSAGSWRRRLSELTIALGGVLAVSGWWFARNNHLYGQFLATRATERYLADWLPGLIAPVPWTDVDRFGYFVPESLLRSVWFDGGWNQLYAPTGLNLVYAFVAAIALFTGARAFVAGQTLRGRTLSRAPGVLLASAIVSGIIAVLIVAKDTTQAEGRITYVALSAFATVAVLGAREALGPRRRLELVGLMFWPAALAIYDVYVLFQFVIPLRHL